MDSVRVLTGRSLYNLDQLLRFCAATYGCNCDLHRLGHLADEETWSDAATGKRTSFGLDGSSPKEGGVVADLDLLSETESRNHVPDLPTFIA